MQQLKDQNVLEDRTRETAQAQSHDGRAVQDFRALPASNLEKLRAWGEASSAMSFVFRPSTIGDVRRLLDLARHSGRSIGLRGAGNSYGDAALNDENVTLDLSRMDRVLDWDPTAGRIRVEPGATIARLWQYVLEDGWWPAVVPGTMQPTLGGCAAMNIHGKNAWKEGTIGDHIHEFDLLLASGEVLTCSREQNNDLFFAALGSFGMLGIFTAITLGLKRVHSGLLKVEALASRSLQEMLLQFDEHLDNSDYLVGWIDALAKGKSLGRGQVHRASYLRLGADPYPSQSLRLDFQHLPENLFGFLPRSTTWRFMRPMMNDYGIRMINLGKYWSSRLTHRKTFLQPHAAFHFLLNYVPNWKKSYGPGGLIQYQCFIPKENALDAFSEILRLCQRRGLPNYLTVLKRHRPDAFLISHGVDGYSMAMDFRVTQRRRPRIVQLARELDDIVLDAGGRFYLAKDSTLRRDTVAAYLGTETMDGLYALKKRWDPDVLWQTNLSRRLFEL